MTVHCNGRIRIRTYSGRFVLVYVQNSDGHLLYCLQCFLFLLSSELDLSASKLRFALQPHIVVIRQSMPSPILKVILPNLKAKTPNDTSHMTLLDLISCKPAASNGLKAYHV